MTDKEKIEEPKPQNIAIVKEGVDPNTLEPVPQDEIEDAPVDEFAADLAEMEEEDQQDSQAPELAPADITAFPLYERCFVIRKPQEDAQGNIVIPDVAKKIPAEGVVVAVGEGRLTSLGTTVPLKLQKGDTVFFGQWSGENIKVRGVEITVLREDEIVAVIREN